MCDAKAAIYVVENSKYLSDCRSTAVGSRVSQAADPGKDYDQGSTCTRRFESIKPYPEDTIVADHQGLRPTA